MDLLTRILICFLLEGNCFLVDGKFLRKNSAFLLTVWHSVKLKVTTFEITAYFIRYMFSNHQLNSTIVTVLPDSEST